MDTIPVSMTRMFAMTTSMKLLEIHASPQRKEEVKTYQSILSKVICNKFSQEYNVSHCCLAQCYKVGPTRE